MTKRKGTVYIYILETADSSEQKVLMEARRRAACILLEHLQDRGVSYEETTRRFRDLVVNNLHKCYAIFDFVDAWGRNGAGKQPVTYCGIGNSQHLRNTVQRVKREFETVEVIDLNAIVADWGDEPAELGVSPESYCRKFQQETENYLGSEKYKRWKNAVH